MVGMLSLAVNRFQKLKTGLDFYKVSVLASLMDISEVRVTMVVKGKVTNSYPENYFLRRKIKS
jgi:hypothetical protein